MRPGVGQGTTDGGKPPSRPRVVEEVGEGCVHGGIGVGMAGGLGAGVRSGGHVCRRGEWVGVGHACLQGSYHLHSPGNAGAPLWTLLQHIRDPRLQRGE